MRVVVEVVFIVTDEFELAVKVSFADDVVLQVPKSTNNDQMKIDSTKKHQKLPT